MATKIAFRNSAETLVDGAKSLPQRYFVSPDIFAKEQSEIFSKQWLLVGHQSQVPKPGDYLLTTIAGESVIVSKDQKSQVRGFYNVCRHRGTRLREDACGHASAIQCPYHAWTYALDGRLIGAPHMDDVQGFDKADYSLHRVNLGLWEGLIFVNLVRKLFGVLPLSRCASAVAESFTVRFGRERSTRRAVPRRIHENQSGQEPYHERKRLRGLRRRDRESSAGFLLFDLSEHASESASGIRDGASALAAVTGANTDRVRLAFSSGRVRPEGFQAGGRNRVLGYDQQTGLARVRIEPARNRVTCV